MLRLLLPSLAAAYGALKADPTCSYTYQYISEDEQIELATSAIYLPEYGIVAPKDAEIFDARCGTGPVGQILNREGYTELYCMDSVSWIDDALKSGNYRRLYTGWLGQNALENTPFRERFDVTITVGTNKKGEMNKTVLDELYDSLKVDGHLILLFRGNQFATGHAEGYKDRLDEYVAGGKLALERVVETWKQYDLKGGYEVKRMDTNADDVKPGKSVLTIYRKTA